jgi:hypothetical protein
MMNKIKAEADRMQDEIIYGSKKVKAMHTSDKTKSFRGEFNSTTINGFGHIKTPLA